MILSLPDFAVLEALGGHRVIECGAGSGLWLSILRAQEIDAIGIDPKPGPGVLRGDHRDLAQYRDRLLLIVWPPDGTDLNEWVDVWGGTHLAVCGQPGRFIVPEMQVETRIVIDGGAKDYSIFLKGRV